MSKSTYTPGRASECLLGTFQAELPRGGRAYFLIASKLIL